MEIPLARTLVGNISAIIVGTVALIGAKAIASNNSLHNAFHQLPLNKSQKMGRLVGKEQINRLRK